MSFEKWKKRSEIKAAIRGFFSDRKYLEIDTPVLVTCPGTEVFLEYFKTDWQDFTGVQHPVWLRSSPELHMKQALAKGCDRIYQMGPCFRNHGEFADWHSPEFTMLEWYEKGIEFDEFILQTHELIKHAFYSVASEFRTSKLLIGDPKILSVSEAFKEFLGIEFQDQDPELAKKLQGKKLHSINEDDDFETAFSKVLIDCFEKNFERMGVVVLKDYPASQAALSVIEGEVSKRFEFYVGGIEICNAFKEALDPIENRKRYEEALKKRAERNASLPDHDFAFYAALDSGVEACCGNALGIDRLVALILGEKNLDRVQPFRKRAPFSKEPFGI